MRRMCCVLAFHHSHEDATAAATMPKSMARVTSRIMAVSPGEAAGSVARRRVFVKLQVATTARLPGHPDTLKKRRPVLT
jgi:hypothetical protein